METVGTAGIVTRGSGREGWGLGANGAIRCNCIGGDGIGHLTCEHVSREGECNNNTEYVQSQVV